MASEVMKFLTKLATEPETMSACLTDAAAVLEKAGLDEKTREALTSGDPFRVHAAITGKAAENEEALERSRANAKLVMDVLASDPAVAQWLHACYYQSMQTWRGATATALADPAQWQGAAAASAPQPGQSGSVDQDG
jgi:hypothetical protein